MGAIASQITGASIVYATFSLGEKHQNSASHAFV